MWNVALKKKKLEREFWEDGRKHQESVFWPRQQLYQQNMSDVEVMKWETETKEAEHDN